VPPPVCCPFPSNFFPPNRCFAVFLDPPSPTMITPKKTLFSQHLGIFVREYSLFLYHNLFMTSFVPFPPFWSSAWYFFHGLRLITVFRSYLPQRRFRWLLFPTGLIWWYTFLLQHRQALSTHCFQDVCTQLVTAPVSFFSFSSFAGGPFTQTICRRCF